MQELTKQWNWPETRVFRFDYTDFQPEASRTAIISLAWVQKRTSIFFAQIKNSVEFAGAGITAADCYFGETSIFTPLTNLSAAIINYDLTIAVADDMGINKAIPVRALPSHPFSSPIIFNHDNGTELFLVLQVNAGQSINNLTTGEAKIWFTYIRQR